MLLISLLVLLLTGLIATLYPVLNQPVAIFLLAAFVVGVIYLQSKDEQKP